MRLSASPSFPSPAQGAPPLPSLVVPGSEGKAPPYPLPPCPLRLRRQALRALLSEKRSLIGAAEVVADWAGRLRGGHPVSELYSDWDWGYPNEATWDDGDDGGDGGEAEEGEEEDEGEMVASKGAGRRS